MADLRVEWTSISREQYYAILKSISNFVGKQHDGFQVFYLNDKPFMFCMNILEGEAYYCHPIVALFWGAFLRK